MFTPTIFASIAAYITAKYLIRFCLWLGRQVLRIKIDWLRYLAKALDSLPLPHSLRQILEQPWYKAAAATSGLPVALTVNRLMVLEASLIWIGLCTGVVVWVIFGSGLAAVYWAFGSLFFWILPLPVLLRLLSNRRTLLARRQFGLIVDLLRLQVLAGASLGKAIKTVANCRQDLWGKELSVIVWKQELGIPLNAALSEFAARFNSPEINSFVALVKSAQKTGVPVSESLAVQSKVLRTKRRVRAEEQARLASVKIAIPLVLLIFPALLIVFLAPVVMLLLEGR